jgi:hypothetical protein
MISSGGEDEEEKQTVPPGATYLMKTQSNRSISSVVTDRKLI